MLKKFNINVDGRRYNVVVEDEDTHPQATVAWRAPAPVAPAAAPIVVEAPAPRAPAAALPAGARDVVAPLAGVMDSIEVRIGQMVNVGDKVAVLEAMKMKTDVFAKVAGTVERIAVKAHESVDTGQVILTIA